MKNTTLDWQLIYEDGHAFWRAKYQLHPQPSNHTGHMAAEVWEGKNGTWSGRAYSLDPDANTMLFAERSMIPTQFQAQVWAMTVLVEEGQRLVGF